jgi:hypothetical protein
MDDLQKLNYLISCCEGEAKEITKSYAIKDSSYREILDHFEEQYGNPRLITQDYTKKIIDPQPFKTAPFRQFLNELDSAIRQLSEHGVDTEACSAFIVTLTERNMPKDIFAKWREHIFNDKEHSTNKLVKFLREKLQCLPPETQESSQKNSSGHKDSSPRKSGGTTSLMTTKNMAQYCYNCERNSHSTSDCRTLFHKSVADKQALVAKHNLCFRCLDKNHSKSQCKGAIKCATCNDTKHCTALHNEKGYIPPPQKTEQFQKGQDQTKKDQNQKGTTPKTVATNVKCCQILHVKDKDKVENKTFLKSLVTIAYGEKTHAPIKIMMDDGSQNSWISKKQVHKLGLKPIGQPITYKVTVAFQKGTKPAQTFQRVEVPLRTVDGKKTIITALVRKGPITTVDPLQINPAEVFSHLQGIDFKDFRSGDDVDLLIGSDFYEKLRTKERRVGEPHQPVAVKFTIGWTLSGFDGMWDSATTHATACNRINSKPVDETNKLLHDYFTREDISTEVIASPDQEFRDKVKSEITYDEETQQYTVTIPYDQQQLKILGDNKKVARILANKQQQQLDKTPADKEKVIEIFNQQLQDGIIEEVDSTHSTEGFHSRDPPTYKSQLTTETSVSENTELIPWKGGPCPPVPREPLSRQCHYLPWHLVKRPEHPTTPIRPVMNASRKDRHGNTLNKASTPGPNLYPDLAGVILRLRTHKVAYKTDLKKMFLQIKIAEHQRDLHRFWFYGKILRHTTILFGETPSPYLAMETVLHHANRVKEQLPNAANIVNDSLYCDDVHSGSKDEATAVKDIKELQQFFKAAHFEIHKINSNSKKVLNSLDPGIIENKDTTEVLGIVWDTCSDEFKLDTSIPAKHNKDKPLTKRMVASILAKKYDPIGIEASHSAAGKFILQKLWLDELGWDDPISPKLDKEFQEWMAKELSSERITIPRYFGVLLRIGYFSDASEMGIATVSYAITSTGVNFIMSKTKVKPLKKTTLPRLELIGCVMAAKMKKYLDKELGQYSSMMFSDSTIALSWIKSDASKYKTYVGNRAAYIQDATPPASWYWVPGDQNPADIPLRGIFPLNKEQMKLWLQGPEFLFTGKIPEQPKISGTQEEIKKSAINAIALSYPMAHLLRIERFSDLNKVIRIYVYIFRFLRKMGARKEVNDPLMGARDALHPPKNQATSPPTPEERKSALTELIKADQDIFFSEEKAAIQKQKVDRSSRLKSLNPMIDEMGILRMQGRVSNDEKLILLDKNSHLAELIIRDSHNRCLHAGAFHTLNETRLRGYWIIHGLATVKKFLRTCLICKRAHQPLMKQIMAPLPEFRTTPAPPFTHTGVDYIGPMIINKSGTKGYVLIFTCAVAHGVRLELTKGQDVMQFSMAFSKFIARRGVPSFIYSDNAKTFVKASQNLGQTNPDVTWRFITPYAPWHGAFWERLVRSVKTPLKKIVGKAALTENELSTLLCKIEAQINSRPLTSLIDSADQKHAITPAELINGRPLQQMDISDVSFSPRKRFLHLQKLQKDFWSAWTREYLPSLQQRRQ